MAYESIKDTKKLIEKLKRVCTQMSKYNLNSPCLLQFIRHNGEYDVILSHNPINGDRFDFYKIFSTITYDNFNISEEDESCFETGDERVSIPVIVSSTELTDRNDITQEDPIRYYANQSYDYCVDSYYVFPKFVLKAIKEEIIKDFEVIQKSFVGPIYQFSMNIVYDSSNERFRNTLFIKNSDKLDNLYKLSILPLHRKTVLTNILYKLYLKKDSAGFLSINTEDWTNLYDINKYNNGIKTMGSNNQEFVIYHNDFLQKREKDIYINKFYESDKGNIVSLYFNVSDSHNIHSYFKYRYYEL